MYFPEEIINKTIHNSFVSVEKPLHGATLRQKFEKKLRKTAKKLRFPVYIREKRVIIGAIKGMRKPQTADGGHGREATFLSRRVHGVWAYP